MSNQALDVSVKCPKCGADVGYKCFTSTDRSLNYGYHVARRKLAKSEQVKTTSAR